MIMPDVSILTPFFTLGRLIALHSAKVSRLNENANEQSGCFAGSDLEVNSSAGIAEIEAWFGNASSIVNS